jgi:hypothetical protein
LPLFFVKPKAACFDAVYGSTPGLATNDVAEPRFTIAPRIDPRLAFDRGLSSCIRMVMEASRVTRKVPVELISRKR